MPAGHTTRKPKGFFRRLERFMVGLVMSLTAFVLEKMVMRSVKRDGGDPKRFGSEATSITTKGADVDFEPDR
jgi:hypothetical protein